MPSKLKKTSPKARSRRASSKAKPAPFQVSNEDVLELENEAAAQRRSEKAWLYMTQAAPDDNDRWIRVEDQLAAKWSGRNHSERRWKYFSK